MSTLVRRIGIFAAITAAPTTSTGVAHGPPPAVVGQPRATVTALSQHGAVDRVDVGDFYYFNGTPVRLQRSLTDTVVRFRSGFTHADDVAGLASAISPQATVGPGVHSSGREYRVVKVPLGQGGPGAIADQLRSKDEIEFAAPALIHPNTGRSLLPTEEILVKVRPGTSLAALADLAAAQNVTVDRSVPLTDDEFVLVLASPKNSDPVAISRALHESGALVWSEPNFLQETRREARTDAPRFGELSLQRNEFVMDRGER